MTRPRLAWLAGSWITLLACSSGESAAPEDGAPGGAAGRGGQAGAAAGVSGASGQTGQAGQGGASGGGPAGASAGGKAGAAGQGGGQAGGGPSGAGGATGGSSQGGSSQGGSATGGQGGEAGVSGGSGGGQGGSAAGAPGGGSGGGQAGQGGASGGPAGGQAGAPVDPCADQTPVCPKAPSGYGEGDGLASIDRCAFPLKATGAWSSLSPLAEALEKVAKPVTLASVLGDLNRSAVKVSSVPGSPPGLKQAFRWDDEDNDKAWWIPQGLSGSPDASPTGKVLGKDLLVVTWYHELSKQPGGTEEKGVRIALVDTTDPAKPRYRLLLLVEPTGTAAKPDIKPVNIHAGGVVWFGDYLYVADTGKGFRVFDLSRILQVSTDQDVVSCAGGTCRAGTYKYMVPQVGAYQHGSACSPLFSWVSLDRSVTPPTLVSGEYCSTEACSGPIAGRTFRWPLDEASGKLSAPQLWPSAAYLMGQKQVQGGAAHKGTFYLSSSAPAGGGGALYRVKTGKSKTSAWIDTPEDLMVDIPRGWLWSLSEGDGERYVMGAALTSYPPP